MAQLSEKPASLEKLIDRYVNLGHKDPHEFWGLLERELGDELADLARPYLADFIADMARQKLNAARRASIAKITPSGLADPEVKLRSLWVPSEDGGILYKRIADMSADDFDARAAYLERMMIGISRHAAWCRSVAEDIRRHGLATAAGLERLPQLPELHELN